MHTQQRRQRQGSGTSDDYETMERDVQFMLRVMSTDKQRDVVWDPFVCSGSARPSQATIRRLGYDVVAPDGRDFFERREPPRTATLVVSNPPFSMKRQVLAKLLAWRLPFALILPSEVVQRDYFLRLAQKHCSRWRLSVLLPNKTLRFHHGGVLNPHLSPFKLAFFVGTPGVPLDDAAEQTSRLEGAMGSTTATTTTINDHYRLLDAAVAPVAIRLFDYERAINDT